MDEQSDNPAAHPGGIFNSLRRMARTLAASVHNRVELFFVELEEEGIRLIGALLLVGFTILLSGLALIMGLFTVLLAAGEENRLMAGIIMTAVLLAGAVASALWLAARLKKWSAFSGTRAELHKDREWLQSKTTKT